MQQRVEKAHSEIEHALEDITYFAQRISAGSFADVSLSGAIQHPAIALTSLEEVVELEKKKGGKR